MNFYFKECIKLSKIAFRHGDVPIAALIVKNGKIIARAYNKKNRSNVSVFHAEILCIIKACRKLNTWRLDGCDIYVTLEPCDMCYSAIVESRIANVYYLSKSTYKETFRNMKLNTKLIMAKDTYKYRELLSSFFLDKR